MAKTNTIINTNRPFTVWQTRLVIVLVGGICISGCTSTRPANLSDYNFSTLITDENVKRFEYAISRNDQLKLRLEHKTQPHSKPRKYPSNKRLRRALDRIIAESQFCRDGYILLGRFAGKTTQRLRGECKEKASPDELARFPNTIKRW